jgi:hypothetical protein
MTEGALRRYWIEPAWPKPEGTVAGLLEPFGFGVTAFSLDDALGLLRREFFEPMGSPLPPVRGVIEDVDVSTLDDHVRPNMHPPNWRGVWYPMLKPLR